MSLIIYNPKWFGNNALEALKNKNNNEVNNSYNKLNILLDKYIRENIINSYNNYLYKNALNISDIYLKKNEFRIYKEHSKFDFYDSFKPCNLYNLINVNKIKQKYFNNLFVNFITKGRDILKKKELYYDDDKIGKINRINTTHFLNKGLLPMKFFHDSNKLFFKQISSYIKNEEEINAFSAIKNDKKTDAIQIILNKNENFNFILYPPLLTIFFSQHQYSFLLIDFKPEKILNKVIIDFFIYKVINKKAIAVNYLSNNPIKSQKELLKEESKISNNDQIRIRISKKIKRVKNKNKKLDYFTSKDIQDKNKEITRIFQKEALDYIDDDEETENETIAKFLIDVANISRRAYNSSNDLLIKMFEEFLIYTEEKKSLSSLKNDEHFKKEFSSWVKEYEKETEEKKEYEKYFNLKKIKGKFVDNKYLSTLFFQLTILYFHCELSFPNVEIDFNYEIKFNHEKMIDFINKGNKKEVNFVILPSLFSNGNYLENGKSWVFTYKKKTFKFKKADLKFEDLVYKKKIFIDI